jgi:hypothetical protein
MHVSGQDRVRLIAEMAQRTTRGHVINGCNAQTRWRATSNQQLRAVAIESHQLWHARWER